MGVYITSAIMPPPVLPGSNDSEKLATLCSYSYKDQAVWFLNAFWTKGLEGETERLWGYVQQNNELDLENHADGCALDEMKAHVFLEKFSETLTVREMRDKLRSTGAIGQSERPKLVPLTHYLLFRYEGDWHHLVNAPQGDNQEEIERAQQMLKEVQEAYRLAEQRDREATAALKEATAAEKEAKAREADAKAKEADALAKEADAKAKEAAAVAREEEALSTETAAKAREAEALEAEAPFKAAQEEVSAALAEVHKQESEYQGKIADCERRSSQGGVVQQNKAKAELAQLKAEDPLPLSQAKITLEAAEKRATKARAPFEAASKVATEARAVAEKAAQEATQARTAASSARASAEQAAQAATQARAVAEEKAAAAVAARREAEDAARAAENARVAAEQARQRSEAAKLAAEQALADAVQKVAEAEAYLQEQKANSGSGQGTLWWIERELHEAKKYKPTSKGGIAK